MMNCFEWRNRASDYLDGALMGQIKRDADEHLDQCQACKQKHGNYRQILASLGSQPRHQLMSQVNAPAWYQQTLKWLKSPAQKRNSTPWFIRGSVEGLGMAALLLALVVAVPKFKSIYDAQRRRRLEAFFEPAQKSSEIQTPQISGSSVSVVPARTVVDVLESDFETDEAADSGESPESTEVESASPHSNEIWRFGIKTPSPHDLKPLILKALNAAGAEFLPGKQAGLEAPGGIQFEAWVLPDQAKVLKEKLHELSAQFAAKTATSASADSETNDPNAHFTWYKNKARKKSNHHGKTRVIIWLSQI